MSAAPEMPLLNLVAARLFITEANSPVQNAMATLIAPTLAVTSDHVLQPFDRGRPRTNFKVQLSFDARSDISIEVEASVIVRDPAVDFAILQLKPGFTMTVPDDIIAFETPPRGSSWQSLLFTPESKGVEVNGAMIGSETIEGHEHLHLSASHPAERGSSGAPIIVNNRVVGIMARRGERENDWYAIPVNAMLNSRVKPNLKELLAESRQAQEKLEDTESVEVKSEITPDNATLYQRLSPSSRRAFNHAEGIRIALERDVIHMEHLLAGLFEKTDGPTERVMKAAGIDADRLHQLLEEEAERDFPRRDQYTPADLNALPRLSAHAYDALRAAYNAAETHRAPQIQSRHLIYGALSVTHCGMIKRLLDLGVDKDKINLAPDRTPDANAQQIAGYQSDAIAEKDLLGITREVQALAALIAAKDVKPPISLGLFGKWGSGKSSFMRQLEIQIRANQEHAKEQAKNNQDSPYCRDIVQLWFNAWYYIDTTLWGPMAQRIFDGLKESLVVPDKPKPPEVLEYERAKLEAQTIKAKAELASAQQTQQKLESQMQRTEAQLAALNRGEGALRISPFELLDDAISATEENSDDKKPSNKKVETAEEKITEKQNALTEKLDTNPETVLREVNGSWKRMRALWLALRTLKNRWFWLLLVGVILVIVIWLQSRGADLYTMLLASVGVLVPALPFIRAAKRALSFVNEVIQTREKTLQDQRDKLEKELKSQQKTVQEKTQAVQIAEQQLDSLRANKQIANFINQRSASKAYAQYSGVIAQVREDFDQLSKLLATELQQRQEAKLSDAEALLPRIDRIVLYIDDLDRCPHDKVFEVLQAVHLLLAFPLFVVIVGVDPNWLLLSLKKHVAAEKPTTTNGIGLSDEENLHWQSTPMHYLEKIFQIPYTLRPMGKGAFHDLIENLAVTPSKKEQRPPEQVAANVEQVEVKADLVKTTPPDEIAKQQQPSSNAAPVEVANPTTDVPPADAPPAKREPPALPPPPVIINPEFLNIESWEMAAMKQLHSLIPSPRAAKRFVNIYRLLRVSVAPDKRTTFISKDQPAQHRAAMLLLAMLIGYPAETSAILHQLRNDKAKEKTWWDFVKTCSRGEDTNEKQWQELQRELEHEDIRALIPTEQSCEHFITWANEVARYSFQSGRVLLES